MSAERGNADLRQLFAELTAEDRRLARPFSDYEKALEASRAPRRVRPRAASPEGRDRRDRRDRRARPDERDARRLALRRPGLRSGLALAALLLAALGLAVWHQAAAPRARPAASLAEISRWHAPTDFLLHTPGEALLRSVPRFNSSPHDPLFGGESDESPLPH